MNYGYSNDEWLCLHANIQQRFGSAVEEIRAAVPSLQVVSGKTMTELFPLFSFVRFKPANTSGREDVLMGIEVVPDGVQRWRIDADVAAEESGEIFFELPATSLTATTFEELEIGVMRVVDQLITNGKPVVQQLFGSSPTLPSQPVNVADFAHKG